MNSKISNLASAGAAASRTRFGVAQIASIVGALLFNHACAANPIRGEWMMDYKYLFDTPVRAKLDFDRKIATIYVNEKEMQVPMQATRNENEYLMDLGFGQTLFVIKQDQAETYFCGKESPLRECLKLKKEK